MSTVAASGQVRPARVTATSRSANRQESLVRSQSPDSATCSKRESTAPSGLCSVTSASAMSAVPPTSTPFCHSNHTATSPRPACGATAEGGNNRAATARSTASRSADRRQSPVNSPPPRASAATNACAVSSMCSANSGGGSALASSVNTSSSRRRLPATFWKSQAMLRAASRYSTRLLRTSTWMSCGRRTEACSRVVCGAPCNR